MNQALSRTAPTPPDGEQLQAAFSQFNALSAQLADAYGELEKQVAQLSAELAEARRQRLQQLAEKEKLANRLETLLDALPAAVIVHDHAGRIQQVNPKAEEMLGQPLLHCNWAEVAQQRLPGEGDDRRLADGRYVSLRARALQAEGRDCGKLILITDVTASRQLEARLSQQQRLTSLGEMVASLAHQIRTPLAAAMLYLGNINHANASAEARQRFCRKAACSLRHLENMVNDMLVFVRGDVSAQSRFAVAELLETLEQVLQPAFAEAGASLRVLCDAPEMQLAGNPDALASAFQNLATNAIEAAQRSGRQPMHFVIAARREGDCAVLVCEDDAGGIEAGVLPRVFEPFYTTRRNGTGLGLAVVNETVSRHGGDIEIDSRPGEGTRFTVRLPLARSHTVMQSGLAASRHRPDTSPTAGADPLAPAAEPLQEIHS